MFPEHSMRSEGIKWPGRSKAENQWEPRGIFLGMRTEETLRCHSWIHRSGGKKEEDSSLEAGKGEKTRNVHRRACGNFNTALQRHWSFLELEVTLNFQIVQLFYLIDEETGDQRNEVTCPEVAAERGLEFSHMSWLSGVIFPTCSKLQ